MNSEPTNWRSEYRILPDGAKWILMAGRRVIARGDAHCIGATLARIDRGEISRAELPDSD